MKIFLGNSDQRATSAIATKTSRWSYILVASLLLTWELSQTPNLWAQGITGSITGTITDETGAAVGGANVTVRHVETNATRIVTTSDVGSYTVTQLPPGVYSVKVDKATFKAFQQDNITLQINQVVQINAQLTVGAQTETVLVTAAAPVIQTETSSVG